MLPVFLTILSLNITSFEIVEDNFISSFLQLTDKTNMVVNNKKRRELKEDFISFKFNTLIFSIIF